MIALLEKEEKDHFIRQTCVFLAKEKHNNSISILLQEEEMI